MPALPDGPWTVASGDSDGAPLFIRLNTGAATVARHPSLLHRVGIAVPLLAPDTDGLPGAEESGALSRIEASIESALRVGHESILTVVLTTGGMREFVLYTSTPHNVEKGVAAVRTGFPGYEVQCYVEHDKDWDGYASFADALQ